MIVVDLTGLGRRLANGQIPPARLSEVEQTPRDPTLLHHLLGGAEVLFVIPGEPSRQKKVPPGIMRTALGTIGVLKRRSRGES